MEILTHVIALLVGAFFGVCIMAAITLGRAADDDLEEDSEALNFLSRNALGLSVIKNDGMAPMWAVTTPAPIRVIGGLSHDPRSALNNARFLMLGGS